MAWLLMACGAFATCGAVGDWDWFMNHRKARFFVRFLGRPGTRVFYGMLGAGLVTVGVLIATGIVESAE